MRLPYLLLALPIVFFISCKKDERYLWRDPGVWEIESMTIEYLNSSGGVDSTVTAPISGFFMFYNTPTDEADPMYLITHAMTVKGREQHGAHYWRTKQKVIYLVNLDQSSFRVYTVDDKGRNKQTWDYEGKNNGLHTNTDTSVFVREHIELIRVKR